MKRRPLLESALLGLLAQRPMTGYGLRRIFATTPMGLFSDSPGSVYPALARLERDGLVRASRQKAARPGGRLLEPTRRGRAELRRWLSLPVTREDVARRMDELLLRFAFLDQHPDAAAVERFLAALAEEAAAYAKELRAQARKLEAAPASTGRLALEHGIAAYRATARWARRARDAWRKSHASDAI
ncbi:MAG: PadR family transcriptional regulator [Bryobacteraceae bacterium]|nr:PadR family transcriptional regulator [Bryobacteraceae bacterium]MCX7605394.1 PadR family transcriptional regulator [Bryobacteraceae bacterium]